MPDRSSRTGNAKPLSPNLSSGRWTDTSELIHKTGDFDTEVYVYVDDCVSSLSTALLSWRELVPWVLGTEEYVEKNGVTYKIVS